MSRTGSTTSRPTNGHFSSTIGYGSRPASSLSRPQSSIGSRKLNTPSVPRPATSLDTHGEDGGSILGKRKGMPLISYSPNDASSYPLGSSLDSPSTGPRSLSIPSISRNLAHGKAVKCSQTTLPGLAQQSVPTLMPRGSRSPSTAPILTPSKARGTPSPSPRRSPRRPPIPSFLTKESSTTNFDKRTDADWDRESREKTMDDFFAKFMSRMDQQGQASYGLKETVELYKSRSK